MRNVIHNTSVRFSLKDCKVVVSGNVRSISHGSTTEPCRRTLYVTYPVIGSLEQCLCLQVNKFKLPGQTCTMNLHKCFDKNKLPRDRDPYNGWKNWNAQFGRGPEPLVTRLY